MSLSIVPSTDVALEGDMTLWCTKNRILGFNVTSARPTRTED